jgi:hypothetical protein
MRAVRRHNGDGAFAHQQRASAKDASVRRHGLLSAVVAPRGRLRLGPVPRVVIQAIVPDISAARQRVRDANGHRDGQQDDPEHAKGVGRHGAKQGDHRGVHGSGRAKPPATSAVASKRASSYANLLGAVG